MRSACWRPACGNVETVKYRILSIKASCTTDGMACYRRMHVTNHSMHSSATASKAGMKLYTSDGNAAAYHPQDHGKPLSVPRAAWNAV
jgi:hypothetical protein